MPKDRRCGHYLRRRCGPSLAFPGARDRARAWSSSALPARFSPCTFPSFRVAMLLREFPSFPSVAVFGFAAIWSGCSAKSRRSRKFVMRFRTSVRPVGTGRAPFVGRVSPKGVVPSPRLLTSLTPSFVSDATRGRKPFRYHSLCSVLVPAGALAFYRLAELFSLDLCFSESHAKVSVGRLTQWFMVCTDVVLTSGQRPITDNG